MSALRCRSVGDLGLQPRAVARERQSPSGARRDRHQEQPHVEPGQHHDRAAQEQHVADPGQRRLRRDPLDLADVVVDARHDVAERVRA